MPRSNSTGPSKGRRTSTSRPDPAGRSGGKRSQTNPSKNQVSQAVNHLENQVAIARSAEIKNLQQVHARPHQVRIKNSTEKILPKSQRMVNHLLEPRRRSLPLHLIATSLLRRQKRVAMENT